MYSLVELILHTENNYSASKCLFEHVKFPAHLRPTYQNTSMENFGMNYRSLSTANFGMSNTNDLQLGVAMEKKNDADGAADSDIQVGRREGCHQK